MPHRTIPADHATPGFKIKGCYTESMQRETRQRQAIRKAFDQHQGPLSPQQVLQAAQLQAPGLGIATVYRTLKMLQNDGWLCLVELPGQPARYERSGKRHHHHFHCRACGEVFEIEACPCTMASMAPRDFQLERHEIVLYGLCKWCRQSQNSPPNA